MQNSKDAMYKTKDSIYNSLDEHKSHNVDVLVDLGHPLVNRVVDGFLKVGGVGALNAASQDAYKLVLQEEANKSSLECMVQNMGKQSLQWGLAAGVYSGAKFGLQEARGVRDWKNAVVGGALAGAALSLTEPNPRHDRVMQAAITGAAVATAAELLRNLTH
ncbi:hypothetical protein SUGI_0416730 [Cryptomeria japonica]|nr:hypothetical protein SUGI_0416730 [Cryptomeria japonica]